MVAFLVILKNPVVSSWFGLILPVSIIIVGRELFSFVSPIKIPVNGSSTIQLAYCFLIVIGLITLYFPPGLFWINGISSSSSISMKLSTPSFVKSGKYFSSLSDQYLMNDQPEKISWNAITCNGSPTLNNSWRPLTFVPLVCFVWFNTKLITFSVLFSSTSE